jgi:hypothetical protein
VRRLEGHAYPYDVLMGMPQSVPVRPMSGGLMKARGAPIRRARVSVRRADGHSQSVLVRHEWRLDEGARCAV